MKRIPDFSQKFQVDVLEMFIICINCMCSQSIKALKNQIPDSGFARFKMLIMSRISDLHRFKVADRMPDMGSYKNV